MHGKGKDSPLGDFSFSFSPRRCQVQEAAGPFPSAAPGWALVRSQDGVAGTGCRLGCVRAGSVGRRAFIQTSQEQSGEKRCCSILRGKITSKVPKFILSSSICTWCRAADGSTRGNHYLGIASIFTKPHLFIYFFKEKKHRRSPSKEDFPWSFPCMKAPIQNSLESAGSFLLTSVGITPLTECPWIRPLEISLPMWD